MQSAAMALRSIQLYHSNWHLAYLYVYLVKLHVLHMQADHLQTSCLMLLSGLHLALAISSYDVGQILEPALKLAFSISVEFV